MCHNCLSHLDEKARGQNLTGHVLQEQSADADGVLVFTAANGIMAMKCAVNAF